MKALVMKDIYVLWRHMKIFVLVLVIMSATGNGFNNVFIVVWSAMLPYSAMAYDERSHWDQMAAVMPYTRRDIVMSKYVLGWLAMTASAVMSMIVQTAASFTGGAGCDLPMLMISLLGGVISIDLILPMAFRFGVEKGRMVFFICFFAIAIVGGVLAEIADQLNRIPVPAIALMPVLAIATTAVSIPLSMKLYRAE